MLLFTERPEDAENDDGFDELINRRRMDSRPRRIRHAGIRMNPANDGPGILHAPRDVGNRSPVPIPGNVTTDPADPVSDGQSGSRNISGLKPGNAFAPDYPSDGQSPSQHTAI